MKKNIQSLIIILILGVFFNPIFAQGSNQENSFEVSRIVSPIKDLNYKLNDSADFIIRVRNLGPNSIIAGDFLKIKYSLFSDDGNDDQSFDTSIMVGSPMEVGKLLEYKLAEGLLLGSSNNTFIACASVEGSSIYPINTNKFPTLCTPFAVSLEELKLKITNVYYAEGRLYFNLNSNASLTANVFDITGKLLQRNKLDKRGNQSFSFNPPNRGFYFIKILDNKGTNTTAKFIANQ